MVYNIITGASGVLGKEFCSYFASLGENLIITARDNEKLKELANSLTKRYNISVEYFACDMASEIDRQNFFDFLNDFEIDKLILVCGNDNQMAFKEYSQEKIITQIRANFESQVCLTNYALGKMKKGSTILAISSLTATLAMPYFAIYSSCKRAQLDFFRAIKREYKGYNITVALPSSMPTRQDVILDIKKQGLTGKLASQPVEKVVKVCCKKASKNKDVVIIGAYNKLIYFLNKITPLKLQQKIIEKKFKNKRKENF